jgi:hypothetical protein
MRSKVQRGFRETVARRSLRLKVECLEGHLQNGTGADVWLPKTVGDLTTWVDVSMGFTSWSSQSVATINGPNADLRRRFDVVRRALDARGAVTGTAKGAKKRRGREVEHRQALAEVKALAEQNARLIEEKHELWSENVRLRQSLSIQYNREKELIENLNRLLPIDRRIRAIGPR